MYQERGRKTLLPDYVTPSYGIALNQHSYEIDLAILPNQGVASVWNVIPIYNVSFLPNILNMVSIPNILPFSNNWLIWKRSIMVKFLFFPPFDKFISDCLRPRRRTQERLVTLWILEFKISAGLGSWLEISVQRYSIKLILQAIFPNFSSVHFFIMFLTVLTVLSAGFWKWWYELENSRTMSKLKQKL